MNRRRDNEIPSLRKMIRETGYGWILDLVQAATFIVLIVGGGLLIYHLTVSGLQNAFDQTLPHP